MTRTLLHRFPLVTPTLRTVLNNHIRQEVMYIQQGHIDEEDDEARFIDHVLHLDHLIKGGHASAYTYVRDNTDLAEWLKGNILDDDLSRTSDDHRLKRFVRTAGCFSLPRLLYDLEGAEEDLHAHIAELDDIDVARVALDCQLREGALDESAGEIAKAFQHGGALFGRLIQAIHREVIEWPDLYDLTDAEDTFARMIAGHALEPMRLIRFAPISYQRKTLIEGYDHRRITEMEFDGLSDSILVKTASSYERRYGIKPDMYRTALGKYFFKQTDDPTGVDQASGFYHYGLPNREDGIIARVEHAVPMPLFLTFAAASNGQLYSVRSETAVWGEATRMLSLLVASAAVDTRVVIDAFDDTERSRDAIQAILRAGTQVYFGLGKDVDLDHIGKLNEEIEHLFSQLHSDFEDEDGTELSTKDKAWMIINSTDDLPRGHTNTDITNEEAFFMLLSLFNHAEAHELFEAMVEENDEMAERASRFIASMPGYWLPILKKWRTEWSDRSDELSAFLDQTIERGDKQARTYMGKTLHPHPRATNSNH